MRQEPILWVVMLAIMAALFVIVTSAQLPSVVGAHFNFRGDSDGWLARENYLALMVIFVLAYPALMTLAFTWLPRKYPSLVNIPHRDYWLAPERRDDSLKYLATQGCWFSCLLLLTVAGVHYVIVVGHWTQPPTLPLRLFFSLLGGFGVALIIWTIKFLRRFAKPAASVR